MAKSRADTKTLDLFGSQPKTPKLPAYPHEAIRAATLGGVVSRAVSTTLLDVRDREDNPKDREEIAAIMTAYLGEDVPLSMLNGYASQAREAHNIPVIRAMALMHATGDYRLLVLMAQEFNLAVVPKRYENAVREAILAEKIEEMDGELKALRRGRRS